MSGNAKFRWFLLAPTLVALFVFVNSPVVSLAEDIPDDLADLMFAFDEDAKNTI